MQKSNQSFKAAAIAEKFKTTCVNFDNLLLQGNTEELTAIRKKLREELREHKEQGILTVAFVGQYNAGKSTTISALTGRRDIRIDSDIATDETSRYDWNSIKLIDTPGLFTDRQDHDEITYEAISKADLLIFCLTYMLFDSVTAENFKKLAYEKGYRWKMMLLVNKMSDEAGEEDQKIINYRKSLAEALKPYKLDEFSVCFIDAKDYCEGVDEEDDFLIEVSRFQTFTDALNTFVERRASLAQFDTPVRIALSFVDEAQLSFTRDSNEDSTFFEVLTRLSRTVRKERDRLRTKIQNIKLNTFSLITKEGDILANAVGTDANFEDLNKQAEINVRQHYEQAGNIMQDSIEAAVESVKVEVEKVFQSDLMQAFLARLEFDQKISAQDIKAGMNLSRLRDQVSLLEQIGQEVGVNITKAAIRGGASTTGKVFLRSMDVARSELHQVVYAVGKFVGFKFKPFGAVNIAKGLGNAAMFLGPALAVVSVGVDIADSHKEHKREEEMARVRHDITSQCQSIAKDLESQIDIQLREFESQFYGKIDMKIAEDRQRQEAAIAGSNQWAKQLLKIRQEFEAIIRYINESTLSSFD